MHNTLTYEQQYLDLLRDILENGTDGEDRTGTGTRSLFGTQIKFSLEKGFPLLTTKKLFTKGMIHELLWFLSGDTNISYLQKNGVHIWDDWALKEDEIQIIPKTEGDLALDWIQANGLAYEDGIRRLNALSRENGISAARDMIIADGISPTKERILRKKGDLGPVYGKQWVNWETKDGRTINQIQQVLDLIKNSPNSRRILFTGWNVGELEEMALPPCHHTYQFYVRNNKLSVLLYQRSADVFLGLPWNIAETAMLTQMFATLAGLGLGTLTWCGGDTHLYHNHLDQVQEQLGRTPTDGTGITLTITRKPDSIFDFVFEDFEISNYHPQEKISAPLAV